MLTVRVEQKADLTAVAKALATAESDLAGIHPYKEVVVHIGGFLRISAIAMLTAWARDIVQRGLAVHFRAPTSLTYLERMGVLELTDAQFRPAVRARPEGGRFVTMHDVSTQDQIGDAIDRILEFLMYAFNDEHELLAATEWVLGEMLDNVHEHARDPGCAVAVAQRYDHSIELELAVVDRGVGLGTSLHELQPGASDLSALGLAVRQGVSSKGRGRGNGLAGITQIARVNEGRFSLMSGGAARFQWGDEPVADVVTPTYRGTCVSVVLRSDRGVDLSQTLIGSSDWTYFDRLWSLDEGVIRLAVASQLETVATRDAARRLANYLANLLRTGQGGVELDFARSGNPTTAFMGELLQQLVDAVGQPELKRLGFSGLSALGRSVLHHASIPYDGLDSVAEGRQRE